MPNASLLWAFALFPAARFALKDNSLTCSSNSPFLCIEAISYEEAANNLLVHEATRDLLLSTPVVSFEICRVGPVQAACRTSGRLRLASSLFIELLEIGDLAGQECLLQTSSERKPIWPGYGIWWPGEIGFAGELRNAVGRAFDSQFFHAVSQGVGMHAQRFSCTAQALYHPVSFLKHCQDVRPFNLMQGFK